jgi:hypothetical protein
MLGLTIIHLTDIKSSVVEVGRMVRMFNELKGQLKEGIK